MPFAPGTGLRQWLVPQLEHVTGGGEGSSAPHAGQKRTVATAAVD